MRGVFCSLDRLCLACLFFLILLLFFFFRKVMKPLFDHEKLEVYQRSIDFAKWCVPVLDCIPASTSIRSQLDRASVSIPLNIAEGNGKWSRKDRCRFFDISRGSALECAAALDIASARGLLDPQQVTEGKCILIAVVRMLIGLIQANDPERGLERGEFKVGENLEEYRTEKEKE